jgi:hypothetical protein
MEDKELLQIALGLSSPWFVKDIDLNTSKKRMDIYLDFTKGTKFPCPICNKSSELHDTKKRYGDISISSIMKHIFIQECHEQNAMNMV